MKWSFRKKNNKSEERGYFADALTYNNGSGFQLNKSMMLSTVYRAVECISDSIAQLPLLIYETDNDGHKELFSNHPAAFILNNEPNNKMTRYTFIKLIISTLYLKGAAFAYIQRDMRGNAQQLIYIDPDFVTILETPTDLFYSVPGISQEIESCDMLHFLNYTQDGIHGISTVKMAINALELAKSEQDNATGFFKGGSNLSGILTVESSLTSKQKNDIKSSWQQAFTAGPDGSPGGVAVLEGNMSYSPVTVSPQEAELLASRQYSVVELCRFFGINPTKAFDMTHSSYSTIEATQLSYLTDTISPLCVKLEQELQRKIFKPSEKSRLEIHFDISKLMAADMSSKASYYNTLYQIGAISQNEIRKELNLSHIDGGDTPMTPLNMSPTNLSEQTDEHVQ